MQEINVYHLIKYYIKNLKWMFASAIIGLLIGVVYNNDVQIPLYRSNATLLLIASKNTSNTQDTTLINNYIELFKSRRVLEPIIQKQNTTLSYESLATSVTANNTKGTEVIRISIRSTDPQLSKLLVDDAISSFKEEVKKLYGLDNIQVVDTASLPTMPYNVKKNFQLLIASLSTLILTLIILFFIYDFKLNGPVVSGAGMSPDARIAEDGIQDTLLSRLKSQFTRRKRDSIKKKAVKSVSGTDATSVKTKRPKSTRGPGRPKKRGRPRKNPIKRTSKKSISSTEGK